MMHGQKYLKLAETCRCNLRILH